MLAAALLTVAAAANVRPALEVIRARYEKRTGTSVVVSYGSSGILTQQIENGAPFDLFLSADKGFIERLSRKGLVERETERVYAVGELVLAFSVREKSGLKTLEDLGKVPAGRIAIANPETAPYGAAAVETLKSLRLWESWKPRIVYAENVRDALRYAQTGDAEFAFAALSEAQTTGLRYLAVPESLHSPIVQEMCVLSRSRNKLKAKIFLQFLLSPDNRALWKRFGYRRP